MSDGPSDALQFETAQTETAAPPTCGACKQPISGSYFTVGGQIACERCKSELELALQQRPGFGGFVRATLLGSLAGAAGAAVWYGVRAATDYELGLIAIAVGYGVGVAVKKGSGGRGGPLFQALAIALTYFWIAANYIPDIAANLNEPTAEEASAGELGASADGTSSNLEGPAFAVAVVVTALALPFLMGFENAIGILIIGFALYEAWKINKRVAIPVAGPFALGSTAAPQPGASG